MARGAVILLENDTLILIERVRSGRTYYLFPGGGVEVGETPAQAAIREANEELGLSVAIERLVAVVMHEQNRQYYFLAMMLGGQFGTGYGAEMGSAADSAEGSYRPVRLPLDSLADYDIRPKALAQAVTSHRFTTTDSVLYLDD